MYILIVAVAVMCQHHANCACSEDMILRAFVQGLGKSCLYCGDGINDLEALANADVGMAVGSAEASAAATFSDKHFSVAGQP